MGDFWGPRNCAREPDTDPVTLDGPASEPSSGDSALPLVPAQPAPASAATPPAPVDAWSDQAFRSPVDAGPGAPPPGLTLPGVAPAAPVDSSPPPTPSASAPAVP